MNEEEIYELISEEIESNSTKKGIWTKAFSESEGDEQKTKALYIKYRFDQINEAQTQLEQETIVKDDEEKVTEKKVSNEYKIKLSDRVIKEEKYLGQVSALKNDEFENSIKDLRNNNESPRFGNLKSFHQPVDSTNSKIKFGGLLLFFAFIFPIGIILGPLVTLIELGKMTEMTFSSNVKIKGVVSTYNNRMIFFQIIWFLWTIYLLFPFFNKKDYFPITYFSSIVINFVISFSIILLFAKDLSYINNNIIIGDLILGSYSDPKIVFVILIQLLWVLYFLFSSRAKNTFNQQ